MTILQINRDLLIKHYSPMFSYTLLAHVFSGLKSLSQSKQWHFLDKNGKGIPIKRIAVAIAPRDGFGFETSKEPHTGHFNFFIDNYRILK